MTEDDDWFEAALRRDDGSEDESEGDGDDSPESPESMADDTSEPPADGTTDVPADDPATAGASAPTAFGTDDATGSDGDAPLFDDDFATAFRNAPGTGLDDEPDFGGGFGDAGGLDAGGFDDEDFESNIPRVDVGIEGLDGMIQGGVPERTLMVAIGNAGTGKTTFGLQFLDRALSRGENAVYITLEESRERILDSATEKGWPYDRYVEDGLLAVVDVDPIEMANSLSSIQSELPELVRDFGATRLVLDSVSLLEMMYEDRATRRNEIYDFTRSLKEAGVTTMLTSEASDDNPYASRHGIIEYLTDAVFVLQYVRGADDFRETRLAIEIQKIRDANHSREIKPYDITNEGISVYQQANLF
ncbi:KaiC domain-containing protein [Haladaptatus salinisoli]|uniref:KaiC domain-containing protein n=1 Tax=Haladaptatus salinisoli TaxID=2884876 RepID=UPI001D09E484|nr:KaiC domain-containing protein [Haladaptatus salinisoli]